MRLGEEIDQRLGHDRADAIYGLDEEEELEEEAGEDDVATEEEAV